VGGFAGAFVGGLGEGRFTQNFRIFTGRSVWLAQYCGPKKLTPLSAEYWLALGMVNLIHSPCVPEDDHTCASDTRAGDVKSRSAKTPLYGPMLAWVNL
jgi:hypothetical protein